jgi:poly(3-hydroxybutyrate) depolymerase
MRHSMKLLLVMLIGLTVNAQTINLRGIVSDQAGKPIAKAIVTLVGQGLKDTTGSDGAYLFSKITTVVSPTALIPQLQTIVLDRGFLEFSLPHSALVKVEIFDVQGTLLKKESLPNAPAGFYSFDIEENSRTTELLIVRTSIDRESFAFHYLPLHKGKYFVNQSDGNRTSVGGKLAKVAAISDTLKASAAGYTTKVTAITSYDQQLNITLDTAGRVVGHSPGCGKTPTLTSGSHTIQSGGQSRSYMLRIPANYDNNHPYPLVFAFHWNGGSMNDIDGGGSSGYTWSYYGLREKADTSANSKMIFVAPNGISAGWANTGDRDLTLVDDLLKLIKGDLCIDTTRIFSMGFSYGGGMSYAIACARANVFRAVAVYSGAQLSGCNGGTLPIAYIGIHGTADGTCNISGGRSLRDKFVTNNVCTKPANVPEASSSTHVCYTYQGCKAGYPVEWCTFNGGHTPGNVDGGGDDGAKTWTKGEVWKFFTQF